MVALIKYEIQKVVLNKSVMGACVVFLLVLGGIFNIYLINSRLHTSFHNTMTNSEAVQKNIEFTSKYVGDLTMKKVQAAMNDYSEERTIDPDGGMFNMYSYYTLNTFAKDSGTLFTSIYDSAQAGKVFPVDKSEIKTLDQAGFNQPETGFLQTGNFPTWSILLDALDRIFILTVLLIIFICSTIFSSEVSSGIIGLLLSTKKGRTQSTIAKLSAAVIISVGIFLFSQIATTLLFQILFGFSGWNVSVQANLMWHVRDFPWFINLLQVFLLTRGFQLICVLSIVGATCMISSMTKSPFTSLAISLGGFFAPQLLLRVIKEGTMHTILYLFPSNNYGTETLLELIQKNEGFLLSSVAGNLLALVGILLLLKLLCDLLAYWRVKVYRIS
ncbi:ABC transporter permease subunit [Enterococcus sp. AZ109]|uniref:ABC transporter permease subunit n=1 Tax=Enterococcus sp. AZ109 TaxID=2774634 RepID=UPI003F24920D